MRKFMTHTRAFGALLVSLALSLTACGGGGGGGDSPAPTPTTCANGASDYPACSPAPSLTGVATTPATGAGDVALDSNVQVMFNTNGTLKSGSSTVDATCNGTAVSGNITIASALWTFDPILGLPAGATCTVKFGGTFVSTGGLTTAMSVTTVFTTHSTALRYTDKVLAVWTNGYLYAVTKTSVVAAVNQTSYQTGENKLFNCTAPNKPLPDGNVPSVCTASSDLQRHNVQWNPLTNAVTNYTGTFPSDIVFVSAENNSTQPVAGTTSARVADGWYYSDPAAAWVLKFQADTGGTTTIKAGTFATDGSIKVLRTYSN